MSASRLKELWGVAFEKRANRKSIVEIRDLSTTNDEMPTCTERTKIAPIECGWKDGDSGDSVERESCLTKSKKPLDSDRPSHGRRYPIIDPKILCSRTPFAGASPSGICDSVDTSKTKDKRACRDQGTRPKQIKIEP